MLKKIHTVNMSREEWLAERRKSIGGSEMGAVLGLNKYNSPYSVWAEKTGRIAPQEDNEAMRQGRDLEAYVATRFAEKSGFNVRRENYIIRNDEYPHLHANIDRRIVGEDAGLECKTASAFSMQKFADGEFPESYYAQCVAYMAVCGMQRWYLAALILGRDFKIYELTTSLNDVKPEWCESIVYVSPGEIDALREAAENFWEYVEKDTPPPFDGSDATTDTLSAIYNESSDTTPLELFGRDSLIGLWFEMNDQIDLLKTKKEVIKQTIMDDMKDAEKAICGGHTISWKSQQRRTFDQKKFAKENPDIDLSPYYKVTTLRPFKIS